MFPSVFYRKCRARHYSAVFMCCFCIIHYRMDKIFFLLFIGDEQMTVQQFRRHAGSNAGRSPDIHILFFCFVFRTKKFHRLIRDFFAFRKQISLHFHLHILAHIKFILYQIFDNQTFIHRKIAENNIFVYQ